VRGPGGVEFDTLKLVRALHAAGWTNRSADGGLHGATDWSKDFLTLYTGIRAKSEKEQKDFEARRVLNTTPSLPLADYAGKYSDPLYGELEIALSENNLQVDINHFVKASLQHWHYNTFRGPYEKDWYGKALANFILDVNGKVQKVNFEGMDFTKAK